MIPVRRILLSPFIGVTLIVVRVALYFRSSLKSPHHQRLFSAEELALYNGTDETLPILLGILGSVYDVTKGKSHYGSGRLQPFCWKVFSCLLLSIMWSYNSFAQRRFSCICFWELYRRWPYGFFTWVILQ